MISRLSKSIIVTGSSVIDDNGDDVIVMQMNGNIGATGSVGIGQNIVNAEAYANHTAEANKDFEDFRAIVLDLANTVLLEV